MRTHWRRPSTIRIAVIAAATPPIISARPRLRFRSNDSTGRGANCCASDRPGPAPQRAAHNAADCAATGFATGGGGGGGGGPIAAGGGGGLAAGPAAGAAWARLPPLALDYLAHRMRSGKQPPADHSEGGHRNTNCRRTTTVRHRPPECGRSACCRADYAPTRVIHRHKLDTHSIRVPTRPDFGNFATTNSVFRLQSF